MAKYQQFHTLNLIQQKNSRFKTSIHKEKRITVQYYFPKIEILPYSRRQTGLGQDVGLTRPEWNPSSTICSLQDFNQVTLPLWVSVALSINGNPGTYFTGFFWKPKVNIKRHDNLQSEWSDTYIHMSKFFLVLWWWEKCKLIQKHYWTLVASKQKLQADSERIDHIGKKTYYSVQLLSCIRIFATHGLQHARPPCSSPTPAVYSNSCPSSRWCHPAISSSAVPFSSCPQSFPASGYFQMSQFFASGGQSPGVSASGSVLPMNTLDWFHLGWTAWYPCSSRDSHESSPTPQFKSITSSVLSLFYSPTLTSIHDCWKNHSFD